MLSPEQCSTSVTNGNDIVSNVYSFMCPIIIITELAASEELLKLKTNVKYALKTLQYQLEK